MDRTSLRHKTAQVVNKYRFRLGRQGKPLSFVLFAWQLTTCVRKEELSVSHQTIKNWGDGVHSPEYFFMSALARTSEENSWQYKLALEILDIYKNAPLNASKRKA